MQLNFMFLFLAAVPCFFITSCLCSAAPHQPKNCGRRLLVAIGLPREHILFYSCCAKKAILLHPAAPE